MSRERVEFVRPRCGREFIQAFCGIMQDFADEFRRHVDFFESFNSRRPLIYQEETYLEYVRSAAGLVEGLSIRIEFDREEITNMAWEDPENASKKRVFEQALREARRARVKVQEFARVNDNLVRVFSGSRCIIDLMHHMIPIQDHIWFICSLLRTLDR
jgi:hypothetical protein